MTDPPSFAWTSLIPLDFSSYHSIVQIMHPASDGFTWDSCVTSSFLSHCTRTESIELSFPLSHTHHHFPPKCRERVPELPECRGIMT